MESNEKRKSLNKNIKIEKNNKQRGITLISLVVTIIVLIILAGVSISLVLGENGIITKARGAKEQYGMAKAKEQLEMSIAEIEAEEISAGRKVTLDTLYEKLPIKLPGITISKGENELKGTHDGYDFTIDGYFKVTIDGYNPSEGGSEETTTYSVTFNGTNITSNGAMVAKLNESYTAELTAKSGYAVSDIVVKMGEIQLVENISYTYSDGNATLAIQNVNGNIEITVDTLETVESKKTAELTYFSEEKTLVDNYRNKVKVPEGFKIAEDSGINVTEGVVIEDNDVKTGIGNNRGNQYVWIPVGKGIKKSDGNTVDIELGRYVFSDGTNYMDEDGVTPLPKGTPILKQSAENYESETEINITEIDPTSTENFVFKELKDYRAGTESIGTDGKNATALNLEGFVDSVSTNGGYYIARYEASYGKDGKANSKVSNTFTTSTSEPTTEGALWNNIRQVNAAKASRDLYSTVTSDLTNSYAWDTAIVYIQNFSDDSDYSRENAQTFNKSLTNTGVNGDEVCKINDMVSNTREWTTEYASYIASNTSYSYPCTKRGSDYSSNSNYTSYRRRYNATYANDFLSFRTVLYM